MSYSLLELSAEHEKAFLKMIEDYAANQESWPGPEKYGGDWGPLIFRNFLKDCEKRKSDWRPKPGQISETHYVLVDTDGVICASGMLTFPLENGRGNLTFEVPPSKRRQGFGALVLNRMLFEAVRAGLARALVVIPSDNYGAVKTCEKNRATFDFEENGLKYFWIHLR